MELFAYSVYDSVADVFGTPFFAQSDKVAYRSFRMLCEDPNSTVHKNPQDFMLFLVGKFDDQQGVMFDVLPIKQICRAIDFFNT